MSVARDPGSLDEDSQNVLEDVGVFEEVQGPFHIPDCDESDERCLELDLEMKNELNWRLMLLLLSYSRVRMMMMLSHNLQLLSRLYLHLHSLVTKQCTTHLKAK